MGSIGPGRWGRSIPHACSALIQSAGLRSVSTPILWDELDDVVPEDFTIATIWDRLARFGDLFAPVLRGGQRLEGPEEALGIDPGATS